LKPTQRIAAQFSLSEMVSDAGAGTTGEAVDHLIARFLRVPLAPAAREALIATLNEELGTERLSESDTYMEHALRLVAHLIMSSPQYQLA
jgi:hypothetical protein